MKYKVVLVPFPFDDLSVSKVRPAVCLTDPVGPYQHLVLSFITSRIPDVLLPTDLIVDANDKDFAATGLRVSSTLQLHRLLTVSVSFLRRELGTLSPGMQSEVKNRLELLFGLNAENNDY